MSSTLHKDSYRKTLWAYVLLNVAAFWSVVVITDWSSISAIFSTLGAQQSILAVVGPVAMLILNGVVKADTKARLVYWRWNHPLPGSRAFSKWLDKEPRADRAVLENALGALPDDPAAQNSLWYRLYREVEDRVTIAEAHREWLFARDLSALGFIILVVFGLAAVVSPLAWSPTWTYIAVLALIYVLSAAAARNYGERFVCNVLAEHSS